MAKQVINIGASANDNSGDPLRTAFNKINLNFTELYSLPVLPSQTGNTNKYLKTDGSGNLSWSTVESVTSTGDIYFENNNIYNSISGVDITNGQTRQESWNAGVQIPSYTGGTLYIRSFGSESSDVCIQSTHGTWTFGTDASFNLPGMSGGIGSFIQATNDITINTNGTHFKFEETGYLTLQSLNLQGYLKGVDGSTGSTGQVLTRQSNGGAAWTTISGGDTSIHSVTTQSTAGVSIQLTSSQEIIFCDVNAAGGTINLLLPVSPSTGKSITVKNINAGTSSQHLYVQPTNPTPIETEFGYVGSGAYATLDITGQSITWVFDGSTWRIISKVGF